MMRQAQDTLKVGTRGKGFVDITQQVAAWVREQNLDIGLLTVFITHTSASLMIQENADPDVLTDMASFFKRVVPENPSMYRHTMEGPDDMPAHIRSVLTQTQLTIPITKGRLALGTWQGIYVCEHRDCPQGRHVLLHMVGE
jgi:secondary thiamine-phosphate synthase enzyme